jgi:hypothetical protein
MVSSLTFISASRQVVITCSLTHRTGPGRFELPTLCLEGILGHFVQL